MSDAEQVGTPVAPTILIVEDDEGIGMLLEEAFLEEDYKVIFVNGSRKALDVLQRIKPDLFIVDYRLPYMTGLELYDYICSRVGLATIPFILISADLPIDEVKKRPIVGIKKPFDITKLINTAYRLTRAEKK